MEPWIPFLPMIGAFAWLLFYAGVCRGESRNALKHYSRGYWDGIEDWNGDALKHTDTLYYVTPRTVTKVRVIHTHSGDVAINPN